MFEKLLSQLPYNPGLVQQMSFYSRRMREEASIRRLGMIFIVLAFFIQFFAVVSPPKSTVASSDNDLVSGGVSSAGDAARHCRNNTRGFGGILETYGITCQQVANAQTVNLGAGAHNGNLFSMGHVAYGKAGETPVNINGKRLYWRYLSSWGPANYQALKLHATSGKLFYILYNCGNLVSVGIPNPYNPNPGLGNNQPVSNPQTGIGNNRPVSAPAPASTPTASPSPPPGQPPKPCPYDSSITADNTSCKPCDESSGSQDSAACISIRKSAVNSTQGLADANNTGAQAGDVITYTLHAKNNGKETVKNYVFQENLSDVLDYADVTDLDGGSLDNDSHDVKWPAVDLKAGETVTKKITVKVKSPVPQTPVSASDPGRFDLIMTNVYGNAVNINLPGSPGKTVEAAGGSLPNTGPGTNLAIATAIVIIAGYFYSRSRLLAEESNIALRESTSA